MLSNNSYQQIGTLISEVRDYTQCLSNNVSNLATADTEHWRNICIGDIRDAGDHITATIAKIVNLCAKEIGDSVQASK